MRASSHTPDGFGTGRWGAGRFPGGDQPGDFRSRPSAMPHRAASSRGSCSHFTGLGAGGGAGTVVFDEIDAGIGGNTARAVGEKLRELGPSASSSASHTCRKLRRVANAHFRIVEGVRGQERAGDGRAGRRRRARRRDRAHAGRQARRRDRRAATRASCSRRPERLSGRWRSAVENHLRDELGLVPHGYMPAAREGDGPECGVEASSSRRAFAGRSRSSSPQAIVTGTSISWPSRKRVLRVSAKWASKVGVVA